MILRHAIRLKCFCESKVLRTHPFREYAMKSDLKIKWVRPEKVSCVDPVKSGDLEPHVKLDPSTIPREYLKSEELKTADDLVKRMFTLSFLPRKYTVETEKNKIISRVQRHQLDQNSVETLIAEMTANIRNWQELYDRNPHDRVFKVNLKELIEKRRKYLKLLRCYDYKRFEWLLEKLNLRYRPHPSQYLKVTRKDSLRKLTNKYCEDFKQKKLDEYKTFLEGQKLSFLQEKLETLQQFQKEEQELGLEKTITDEEIEQVRLRIQKLTQENKTTASEKVL